MSPKDSEFADDLRVMAERALGELPSPYGPRVMEDVWIQIENHAGLLENYKLFCAMKGQETVNGKIGDLTRTLTGYVDADSMPTTRTHLAESYTVLVPPEA